MASSATWHSARPDPTNEDRESLINDATQKSLERFDEAMRELSLRRYQEFEAELEQLLVKYAVGEMLDRLRRAGDLDSEHTEVAAKLVGTLTPKYGHWLSRQPTLEDVQQLSQEVARELEVSGRLADVAGALQVKESLPLTVWHRGLEALGSKRRTFAGELLKAIEAERSKLWRADRTHQLRTLRPSRPGVELVHAGRTREGYMRQEPVEQCRARLGDGRLRRAITRSSAWSGQFKHRRSPSPKGRGDRCNHVREAA